MATAFLGFGLAYAIWPVAMVKDVGIRLNGMSASTDLRAVYGGMQLGIAAFLYYCASAGQRVRSGLIACLAILAGLAGTRGLLMIATTDYTSTMWSLLAVEGIGVPTAILGLVVLNRSQTERD
jgi:hypothetical protein